MRTNNKGYSLVELVMTLGCFSIIMLAIMLMMRTTIATYKDGLLETKKQQEAQIVANQIAEFIVDADAYAGGYSFVKDSVTRSFSLDADGTLYYGVSGAMDPLSDCVKEFSIEGLESAETDGGMGNATVKAKQYDNACRVKVKINYMDREYEAVKDVHFRNAIENPQQYNVALDASAAPSPAPGSGKQVDVLRFDKVNLTKKYDVVAYTVPADSNILSWYDITPMTSVTADLLKPSGNGITIKCKSPLEETANFTKTLGVSDKCTLDCTLRNGGTLQLTFTTDAVDIDVPAGSVFTDFLTNCTNNGYHQDMPVKGIHINEALKAGQTIKVKVTLESSGTEIGSSGEKTLSANTGSDNGKSENQINIYKSYSGVDGSRIDVGLVPNVFSNDFIISTGNDAHSDDAHGIKLNNSDGKQTITFHIDLCGKPFTVQYKYYMAGGTLEHAS